VRAVQRSAKRAGCRAGKLWCAMDKPGSAQAPGSRNVRITCFVHTALWCALRSPCGRLAMQHLDFLRNTGGSGGRSLIGMHKDKTCHSREVTPSGHFRGGDNPAEGGNQQFCFTRSLDLPLTTPHDRYQGAPRFNPKKIALRDPAFIRADSEVKSCSRGAPQTSGGVGLSRSGSPNSKVGIYFNEEDLNRR
jgi:hypothetical protein